MKLEIQLSAAQQSAVKAVAHVLRLTSADALKVLAFMPVAMNYLRVEEFRDQAQDVIGPVLSGALPDLTDGAIAGCIPLNTGASAGADPLLVQLLRDDIEAICQDIASELHSDAPFFSSIDVDDFRAVLKAWRKHSPRYVEDKLRYARACAAKGDTDPIDSRETLEKWRAGHDAAADRLERLLPYLESGSLVS